MVWWNIYKKKFINNCNWNFYLLKSIPDIFIKLLFYLIYVDHDYFKGIDVEIINVWKDTDKPPFKDTDKGNTRLFERKLNRYDKQYYLFNYLLILKSVISLLKVW